MSSSRSRSVHGLRAYTAVLLVALAAGLIAGAGTGLLALIPGPLGTLLTVGVLALAMACVFAAVVWWWRGIDEAARAAHKWAWWWGGTAGMVVGAVALMTLTLRGEALVGQSPAAAMATGMLAMLLLPVLGYSAAWVFWWLRNR